MENILGKSDGDAGSVHGLARKPYEAPKLHVYGNIAAVTRSLGMTATAQSDGGMGNNKTH